MTSRILPLMLLFPFLLASVSMAQDTIKLNGGLEATILQVGRSKDHRQISVALRLANKGTSSAYLLLVDRPVVTDNLGVAFARLSSVGGIANCDNSPASGWKNEGCLGIPEKNNKTVPIQSLTALDPSQDANGAITVTFVLAGGTQSDGPLVSFAAKLYYRFVGDPLKDDTLSDVEKYKQFRLMTLSFPPRRVTDAQ